MNDNEYTYEYIEDIKKKGKTIEVLIKWEGYPTSDNSWEPLTNVSSLKQRKALLEALKIRLQQKPRAYTTTKAALLGSVIKDVQSEIDRLKQSGEWNESIEEETEGLEEIDEDQEMEENSRIDSESRAISKPSTPTKSQIHDDSISSPQVAPGNNQGFTTLEKPSKPSSPTPHNTPQTKRRGRNKTTSESKPGKKQNKKKTSEAKNSEVPLPSFGSRQGPPKTPEKSQPEPNQQPVHQIPIVPLSANVKSQKPTPTRPQEVKEVSLGINFAAENVNASKQNLSEQKKSKTNSRLPSKKPTPKKVDTLDIYFKRLDDPPEFEFISEPAKVPKLKTPPPERVQPEIIVPETRRPQQKDLSKVQDELNDLFSINVADTLHNNYRRQNEPNNQNIVPNVIPTRREIKDKSEKATPTRDNTNKNKSKANSSRSRSFSPVPKNNQTPAKVIHKPAVEQNRGKSRSRSKSPRPEGVRLGNVDGPPLLKELVHTPRQIPENLNQNQGEPNLKPAQGPNKPHRERVEEEKPAVLTENEGQASESIKRSDFYYASQKELNGKLTLDDQRDADNGKQTQKQQARDQNNAIGNKNLNDLRSKSPIRTAIPNTQGNQQNVKAPSRDIPLASDNLSTNFTLSPKPGQSVSTAWVVTEDTSIPKYERKWAALTQSERLKPFPPQTALPDYRINAAAEIVEFKVGDEIIIIEDLVLRDPIYALKAFKGTLEGMKELINGFKNIAATLLENGELRDLEVASPRR